MGLSAEGVCLRIGREAILQDVGLRVQAGQLLALLGPNGAGKSTLLRILAGSLACHKGTVRLDGEYITTMDPRALAMRRAVLPQQLAVAYGFSCLDVVVMGRVPHRGGASARPVDRGFALEALRTLGMLSFAQRRVETLSGGEHQRVHLARALCQLSSPPAGATPLLLLDEPTSALDLGGQHRVLELAQSLAQSGLAVVAVLHDLNLAARYADRVLLLKGGHVACPVGTPDQVLRPELLESVYGLALERHELAGRSVFTPRVAL